MKVQLIFNRQEEFVNFEQLSDLVTAIFSEYSEDSIVLSFEHVDGHGQGDVVITIQEK